MNILLSQQIKERWKDPDFRKKAISPRIGQKRSEATKEKMRLSAIERNKNPEYIQKLKDRHQSKTSPEKWNIQKQINRDRMMGEQNPMKNPETSKKVKDSLIEKNINTVTAFNRRIRNLYNNACFQCGITNMLCLHLFGCILDVHHINYKHNDNRKENTIPLCHGCHSKTTRNKQYWIGYYTAAKKFI
jgi:hypothetical protein